MELETPNLYLESFHVTKPFDPTLWVVLININGANRSYLNYVNNRAKKKMDKKQKIISGDWTPGNISMSVFRYIL